MCLGVPGRIVAISDRENALGVVEIAGVRREVNLICVIGDGRSADDCIGEWVLVHVGFAMSRLDEAEAAATLRLLAELGEIETGSTEAGSAPPSAAGAAGSGP
ncbi:MAG: HypC/HybG/HupF family hydrogenase formation chaperone [Alphaproteobacteria bacterium]|nr:HypC/HybG/HupF family hydrogenase formation chaperone [Alphaproteobacteria bacterium]